MPEQVTITISKSLFERLQLLSVPLIDTTDTVIERLLDLWDSYSLEKSVKKSKTNSTSSITPLLWKSSRGDVLPVGKELKGTYLGKSFTAHIERGGIRFNGKLYDNLSPAAIAAKNFSGTKGKAANTNGRGFWKFQDPATGQWVPVSVLRPKHRLNADELLAELGNAT